MKQEKAKQAGSPRGNEKTKTSGQKNKSANVENTGATQKTRARTGHGLANEGTNVSYDEER